MKTKIFVVSLRSTIHTKIFGVSRQKKDRKEAKTAGERNWTQKMPTKD